MRIQTYDCDAKLITTMKKHHHHHFSFHLGHQCYEVTPFINVSNFTFVILVLLCHFDTSLDGTVGGWLDVWDKSIIKTNSLTWRYGCQKSCKHQPTFNNDGHMHDKARVKPNLCGLLLLSNVIYLGG